MDTTTFHLIKEYCATHLKDSSSLEETSLSRSDDEFLERLGLPRINPLCSSFQDYPPPPSGVDPALRTQHVVVDSTFALSFTQLLKSNGYDDGIHDSWREAFITYLCMTVPPLLAFVEVWYRLLAGVLAPIGVLLLMRMFENNGESVPAETAKTLRSQNYTIAGDNKTDPLTRYSSLKTSILCICTVASAIIPMIDSLYVLEFGPHYGISLFLASLLLSWRTCANRNVHVTTKVILSMFALVALFLVWDWHTLSFTFGDPRDIHINIKQGLYYNQENPFMAKVVEHWPTNKRSYTNPTPWMYTGDARTGLPYFLNTVPNADYTRVFLPLDDGEVTALDISFPATGHNTSTPVYMILHGVNGGSREAYVEDLVWRRNQANSTVVVMVSRGLMDLPLKGADFFHGARWSDAHTAATTLRRALAPDQMLAGVGYSMGGIVLANYVARSGDACALDAAFAISGALECRQQANFTRSQRLWQPMITDFMRTNQHLAKFAHLIRGRMDQQGIVKMLRATHVTALDEVMSTIYNGYYSLEHFYEEMGALGDIPIDNRDWSVKETAEFNPTSVLRLQRIRTPLCILHSFDDPISTWRTIASSKGSMAPGVLVGNTLMTNCTPGTSIRDGNNGGNLTLLLTEKGGHIGWPTGWLPFRHGWKFMNDAAASFVEAVDTVRKFQMKSDQSSCDKKT